MRKPFAGSRPPSTVRRDMQILFARGKNETDRRSDLPLFINNCGIYRDIEADLPLRRPNGRADYHLVFVADGMLDAGNSTLYTGECILFRPREPQAYTYRRAERSLYYWIHFSGEDIRDLLSDIPSRTPIRYAASASEIHDLLFRIVRAILDGIPLADDYAAGLFRALLALLRGASHRPNPFFRSISMMRDLATAHTVSDYAAAAGMTESHFIRAFKAAMGKTPLAYRTALRIEQAKRLLCDTPIRIDRIAALTGFSDPLYFSRIFRRSTGLSPSAFRRQYRVPEQSEPS